MKPKILSVMKTTKWPLWPILDNTDIKYCWKVSKGNVISTNYMLTLIKTCLNMLIGQKCPKILFFGLIRLTKWSLWATEGYIANQIWMKSIHRKRFSVWYLWTVFGHRLKDVWLCLLLKMAEIPIFGIIWRKNNPSDPL